MINAVFLALERPWPPAIITAGGLLLVTVLDLLFIPRWGINGAAWASLVAYTTMAAVSALWLSRSAEVGFRRLVLPRLSDFSALGELWPGRQRRVPEAEGELPPAEG
jgi:Na+-driven multidrug efflux pump